MKGQGTSRRGMMATTMNIVETENVSTKVYYMECVRYLSENDACDGVLFDQSEPGQMFYLDTTHCVTGKRKKKYNSYNVYAIFGAYVNQSPEAVKDLMLNEIQTYKHWYSLAGQVVYGMRSMNFD